MKANLEPSVFTQLEVLGFLVSLIFSDKLTWNPEENAHIHVEALGFNKKLNKK